MNTNDNNPAKPLRKPIRIITNQGDAQTPKGSPIQSQSPSATSHSSGLGYPNQMMNQPMAYMPNPGIQDYAAKRYIDDLYDERKLQRRLEAEKARSESVVISRLRYDNSVSSLYEDADGYLHRVTELGFSKDSSRCIRGKDIIISPRIISARRLRMQIIQAKSIEDKSTKYKVFSLCDDFEPFCLDELNAKNLGRFFTKRKVTIYLAHSERNNLLESILSFLLDHSDSIDVFNRWGWNKCKNADWQFYTGEEPRLTGSIPTFDMETFTWLALWSYIVNFPIIQDWGLCLELPIAIVSDSPRKVIEQVRTALPTYVAVNNISTRKISINPRSANIFLLCGNRHSNETEAYIKSEVDNFRFRILSGTTTDALLFLSDAFLPAILKKRSFAIHLNLHEASAYDYSPFFPSPDDLPLIKRIFEESSSKSAEENALICACSFLYPGFKRLGQLDLFYQILRRAGELVDENSTVQDGDTFEELIIDFIRDYLIEYSYSGFVRLSTISASDLTSERIFYNDRYLYISTKRFEKLTQSLSTLISQPALKQALVNSCVLCTEDHSFMSKMHYRIDGGNTMCKKMLKFDIHKFLGVTGKPLILELEEII